MQSVHKVDGMTTTSVPPVPPIARDAKATIPDGSTEVLPHASGGASPAAPDLAKLAGLLTPLQLAFVAGAVASGRPAVATAIDLVRSLATADPTAFRHTVDAIIRGHQTAAAASGTAGVPVGTASTATTIVGAGAAPTLVSTPTATPAAAAATTTTTPALLAFEQREVKEVVVLCIDVSGSMNTPFEVDDDHRVRDRTRLDAVKQMFYGFRDQTATYEDGHATSKHLLGLISYDDAVSVHTAPTGAFDVFEDVIDDMETRGMTAIYSAIATACGLLGKAASVHPNADLRVICLSDGQSNSGCTADEALRSLGEVGAVCDCLIVGSSADADLRRLVSATDGECFQIDGLADAYEVLESEAVVSLEARRNGAPRPNRAAMKARIKATTSLSTVRAACVKKGAMVAPAVSSAAEPATFMPVAAMLAAGAGAAAAGGGGTRAVANKRIRKELERLAAAFAADSGASGTGSLFQAFPGVTASGDITQIKFAMTPRKAPYAGRVWELMLDIPVSYPMAPPRVTVVTPIYHYAVSTQGKFGGCLPVLQAQWSPASTVAMVLDQLAELLFEPDSFDPECSYSVRSWLSELKRVNPTEYLAAASAHTELHGLVPVGAEGGLSAAALGKLLGM
jgi:ubiquitin-protein ligase/Mg-chelatase subunit ChlD